MVSLDMVRIAPSKRSQSKKSWACVLTGGKDCQVHLRPGLTPSHIGSPARDPKQSPGVVSSGRFPSEVSPCSRPVTGRLTATRPAFARQVSQGRRRGDEQPGPLLGAGVGLGRIHLGLLFLLLEGDLDVAARLPAVFDGSR